MIFLSPVLNSDLLSRLSFRYASRWRNLRYHVRNTPWSDLYDYEQQRTGRRFLPWLALLAASWRHGASFEDYYHLRFFEKNRTQRREYLTLSLLYELERQRNRLESAQILRDKALFAAHFRDLLGREVWTWQDLLRQEPDETPPPRLVIKSRFGVRGNDIFFPEKPFANWTAVRAYIQATLSPVEKYLCEAYLPQHPALQILNPGTVNTLRVMTYLQGSEVQIWGIILRVGCGNGPDNWAQGGLAVWVPADGSITQEAVTKNPFAPVCGVHPLTQRKIAGIQIPYMEQVRQLARASALRLPDVRTVGWDIAIKPEGPCLVEGNDRWSYLMLQNTLGMGCRHLADAVCDMYQVYE